MPKKSHPQNWKVQNSAGFWKERGMEDLLRAGGYSRLWAPPRGGRPPRRSTRARGRL